MAAIDKCYLNSYQDYMKLKEWMKGKTFITPRGCKIRLSDYLFSCDEKDFFDEAKMPRQIPIMNTPVFVDNYLYNNCKLPFIQDWLKSRYFREGHSKGCSNDITHGLHIPDYEPCTKVAVLHYGLGNNPPKSEGWEIDIKYNNGQSCLPFRYNEVYDFFLLPGEEDEWTITMPFLHCSIRTIIRKIIKKWKLPKNVIVTASSSYKDDYWVIRTE